MRGADSAVGSGIPPADLLIHRYWDGPPPRADYRQRLELLNPEVEVRDWGPGSLPGWISDLIARTSRFVISDRQLQHAANVARACLLWEFGGWWADHDLRPLQPFTVLPSPAIAAHGDGTVCNCWLAFPAEHPVVGRVIDQIESASGPVRRAVEVSGERLWGAAVTGDVPRLRPTRWARHEAWTSSVEIQDRV